MRKSVRFFLGLTLGAVGGAAFDSRNYILASQRI